jgi:hypothetical protein
MLQCELLGYLAIMLSGRRLRHRREVKGGTMSTSLRADAADMLWLRKWHGMIGV